MAGMISEFDVLDGVPDRKRGMTDQRKNELVSVSSSIMTFAR